MEKIKKEKGNQLLPSKRILYKDKNKVEQYYKMFFYETSICILIYQHIKVHKYKNMKLLQRKIM